MITSAFQGTCRKHGGASCAGCGRIILVGQKCWILGIDKAEVVFRCTSCGPGDQQ